MRNKCKHKNKKILTPEPFSHIQWSWCPDCGATRMDVLKYYDEWFPERCTYSPGRWKSPRSITKRNEKNELFNMQ